MVEANDLSLRSERAHELPNAPKKLIEQLRSQVRSWASEDGIGPKDLKKYMLDNINVELETLGYRSLKKI